MTIFRIYDNSPIGTRLLFQMSFFGNWCVKQDSPMTPCDRQWLGRGPMEDVTTHKHDYSWKCVERDEPFKAQNNLYPPCAALSGNLTDKNIYSFIL